VKFKQEMKIRKEVCFFFALIAKKEFFEFFEIVLEFDHNICTQH
jgi:hypothetical protein